MILMLILILILMKMKMELLDIGRIQLIRVIKMYYIENNQKDKFFGS